MYSCFTAYHFINSHGVQGWRLLQYYSHNFPVLYFLLFSPSWKRRVAIHRNPNFLPFFRLLRQAWKRRGSFTWKAALFGFLNITTCSTATPPSFAMQSELFVGSPGPFFQKEMFGLGLFLSTFKFFNFFFFIPARWMPVARFLPGPSEL